MARLVAFNGSRGVDRNAYGVRALNDSEIALIRPRAVATWKVRARFAGGADHRASSKSKVFAC